MRIRKKKNGKFLLKNCKMLLALILAIAISGCGNTDILNRSKTSEINIVSNDSIDVLELVFNRSLDSNITKGWSVGFETKGSTLNESNANITYSTTLIENDTITINPLTGSRAYRDLVVKGIYCIDGNNVSEDNILWKAYSRCEFEEVI